MDYYERALYNQILGSQDPDSGGMTYFYNLKPGHFKIYSTPFDAMWCCVGSGIENHAKYADTIYSHNDDSLWVNLFIPSVLDWQEKDVRVRMETKFPAEDIITLTLGLKRVPGETLRFKTVGAGKPNDVTLIPLAELHHQRYTVYWETMAPEDWKPAPSLDPEKIDESKLTPGLDYKYFEGNWKTLPDFSKLEVKKTGAVKDFNLSIKGRNDHFGVVYSGYLKVAVKGEYIFATKSDDGTRLTLAGRELVLNDGLHAMISVAAKPVLLSPGFYPIEVQFFEGTYGEGIEISLYSPADGNWSRIPKSMLYRRK